VNHVTTVKEYNSYGEELEYNYTHLTMEMRPDFPQPDFYKELFRMWGLDVAE